MGSHRTTDIAYHRSRAETYDEDVTTDFGVYDDLVLPGLFERVVAGPDGRALDLGCGTGALTLSLARRGLTVDAVDHSPDMLNVARRKIEAAGLTATVSFTQADITSLPFPESSFDVVTCQRVLHHVPKADIVIAEVARVLKDSGVFYLSDHVRGTAPAVAAYRWIRQFVRRTPRIDDRYVFLGEHEFHRTPEELLTLLDRHGFSYERQLYGHVGLKDRIPPRLRRRLIWLLSFPWRRGDMLFVLAVQPARSEAITPK